MEKLGLCRASSYYPLGNQVIFPSFLWKKMRINHHWFPSYYDLSHLIFTLLQTAKCAKVFSAAVAATGDAQQIVKEGEEKTKLHTHSYCCLDYAQVSSYTPVVLLIPCCLFCYLFHIIYFDACEMFYDHVLCYESIFI